MSYSKAIVLVWACILNYLILSFIGWNPSIPDWGLGYRIALVVSNAISFCWIYGNDSIVSDRPDKDD